MKQKKENKNVIIKDKKPKENIIKPIYVDDLLIPFLKKIIDKLLKAYGTEAMNDVIFLKNIFLPLSEKQLDKKENIT